jgi:hypothetical protein
MTMRRYLWTAGLTSLIVAIGVITGCASKPVMKEKPPADPLLTSKKPVEGRPHISDTRSAADEDYAPPQRPAGDQPVRVMGVRPVSGLR